MDVEFRVLIDEALRHIHEGLNGLIRPPWEQVAVFVELTTCKFQ